MLQEVAKSSRQGMLLADEYRILTNSGELDANSEQAECIVSVSANNDLMPGNVCVEATNRAGLGDANIGIFLLSAYDDLSSRRVLVSRTDEVEHTGLAMLGNFQVRIQRFDRCKASYLVHESVLFTGYQLVVTMGYED